MLAQTNTPPNHNYSNMQLWFTGLWCLKDHSVWKCDSGKLLYWIVPLQENQCVKLYLGWMSGHHWANTGKRMNESLIGMRNFFYVGTCVLWGGRVRWASSTDPFSNSLPTVLTEGHLFDLRVVVVGLLLSLTSDLFFMLRKFQLLEYITC